MYFEVNHLQAIKLFEDIYKTYSAVYENDHECLATVLFNLGKLNNHLGDSQKSIEYLLKTYEMQRRLFKGGHASIADTLNCLAVIYETLGDNEKAQEYKRKSCEDPTLNTYLVDDSLADSFVIIGDD